MLAPVLTIETIMISTTMIMIDLEEIVRMIGVTDATDIVIAAGDVHLNQVTIVSESKSYIHKR